MNDLAFDAMTRRASLAILSVAGLTKLAVPFAATAKKNKRGNKKNNNDNKAKKKCQAQVNQCATLIATRCTADPDECTRGIECCELLGNCDLSGFLNCAILATN